MFDSKFERIIITKLDYIPQPTKEVFYDEVTKQFYVNQPVAGDISVKKYVEVTDLEYFCNKSWTASFNLNTKSWVSFHTYLPNFYVGENNFFYSGLNEGCDITAVAVTPIPSPTTTTTTTIIIYCNLTGTAAEQTTTTTSTSTTSTSTSTTSTTTTAAPTYYTLLGPVGLFSTSNNACLGYNSGRSYQSNVNFMQSGVTYIYDSTSPIVVPLDTGGQWKSLVFVATSTRYAVITDSNGLVSNYTSC